MQTSPQIAGLEREAWIDLAANADAAALAATGLSVTDIAGAVAVRCRGGGPFMNRAFDAPAHPPSLRAVAEHYAAATVPLFFIELASGDRELADAVAARADLVRYRRAQLHLARSVHSLSVYSTSLEIARARATDMPDAAAVFCHGFDIPSGIAPVFASLLGAARWEIVVARDAGRTVGVGLLYIDGDLGYLLGAATAPGYRERGAQAGLIAERLVIAQRRGCKLVATRTGEPAPGDHQHSQHNLQRAGFHVIGRTDAYAPPGIVWTHGRRSGRR